MEVQHLAKLLSELTPNSECKYVRSEEVCVFVKIDTSKIRLYTKTPDGNEFEFAPTFIQALADGIEENKPFNTSQILNNKGSNRAVIDSIIAHTSEFYWLQEGRSKFLVWVPSRPHKPGELVEWSDTHALRTLPKTITPKKSMVSISTTGNSSYLPYLTALRTKPFMLLAGISGTGKSRIVREMAKACWTPEEDEYGKNCPRNFCMVQVKPNWHDSSDLIGYVSRINGEKYVVGPFLRFIAKAIQDPKRPYFLCLDEMNLAPVEQYFAEYLSVIESRKLQDGHIETDPIVPYENTEAYGSLIDQLFDSDEERKAYKTEEGGKRLTIPENLFVVGTVNMDETTFSFSRKVLDRAMTIEMNEVDLKGGLEAGGAAEFGYIGEDLMGDAAEGKDIYADNQALCDEVISYLGKVNEILEGTPFKIAYRTRNEFLLYAVNRLHFAPESEVWQTLDEMTSMKILSRIEGDNERCEHVLRELKNLLTETVGNHAEDSASLKKIDEMLAKLKSGYTSYWA